MRFILMSDYFVKDSSRRTYSQPQLSDAMGGGSRDLCYFWSELIA